NPLLELVSRPVFRVLAARFSPVGGPPGFWDDVVADHRLILAAITARDAAAASAASAAHLARLRPTYEQHDRSASTTAEEWNV
ncbi:MAG TPA: FCD domain-containing protein, partial [Candidatus Nanopelagicales bacterium]|nr:FCD domain-containing protein [Candidatus Nanopelagicales bacterium]